MFGQSCLLETLVVFVVVYGIGLTAGQNCAFPSKVTVRGNESLTETLSNGRLVQLGARNVVEISSVLKNPDNFAEAILTTGLSPVLSLEIAKPLWDSKNPRTSYIDRSREKNVEISLNMRCNDGNSKNVTFAIPIIDENTEVPRFEKEEYHLIAEPCVTGRCVLLFDSDIIVIDQDRDEENALFEVDVDCDEIKVISDFNTVEPWYEDTLFTSLKAKKGYQKRISLEFTPKSYNWMPTHTISFNLTVRNRKEPVKGMPFPHEANATVYVTFEEKPGRILPPVFSCSFYWAHVEYSNQVLKVEPNRITAKVPWNDSSTIQYFVEEGNNTEWISIDSDTGSVTFTGNPNILMLYANEIQTVVSYNNRAIQYVISAERSVGEDKVKAFAPLTIFYSVAKPPTTTIPPGTCPDPDPCECSTSPPDPPETTPINPPETTEVDPPDTTEINPPETTEIDPPETTEINPPETTEIHPPETTEINPPETTEINPPETTEDPTSSAEPIITDPPEPSTTGTPIITDPPEASTTGTPIITDPPEASTTGTPITTEKPTTIPPTTELPPPGDCTCDCDEFSCADPESEASRNSSIFSLYPDPYNCTRYYSCPVVEEGDDPEVGKKLHECPTNTVFCPPTSDCQGIDECLQTQHQSSMPPFVWVLRYGYDDFIEADKCDNSCECESIPPGSPNNLCNASNYEDVIEDPHYCDMFHRCQPDQLGRYIDYPMKCKAGMVFCPLEKTCVPPFSYPGCECPKTKRLKQCDTCLMGAWENFDIFLQKFIDEKSNSKYF